MMELYKKLHAVKSEIGKVSKDSKNPFFKSKYFDINSLLENVEPLLHKHNLLLIQPIENNCVVSRIIDIEEGKSIESSIALPNLPDPQKLGSAITYFRRYTLQSLLGVQAEDDDGNKAAAPVKKVDNSKKLLDQKGYDYLMTEGTQEQIKEALEKRIIKAEWKTALETKSKGSKELFEEMREQEQQEVLNPKK